MDDKLKSQGTSKDIFNQSVGSFQERLKNLFAQGLEGDTSGDSDTMNQIKYRLVSGYTDYTYHCKELYTDGINIQRVLPHILQLQHDKERVYANSWRKYGISSAFMNTARKWDRIENIMTKVLQNGEGVLTTDEAGTSQETFMDTLVDLALYSLLWLGYMAEKYPEMWENFLKMNQLIQGDMEE